MYSSSVAFTPLNQNRYSLDYSVFSTFFGSRHPLELTKNWRHPNQAKNGNLSVNKKTINTMFGGTPDTSSRHPGRESLHQIEMSFLKQKYKLQDKFLATTQVCS